MDSNELKNLQAPLKEKYMTLPESAIITLKPQGKIGDGISCTIETGRAFIEAGLHPATGGTGLMACSGDLDFRGTLGVSKEVPVGFKTIRLEFNLDSDANAGQMESIKKLTERYCVVYQTLTNGVNIETQYHLSS